MDEKALNLLILEDNPDDAGLILKELKRDGFIVKCNKVETKKAFKEALAEKPDIILSDYQIPSFNGKAALQIRQKLSPDIPMIILSGSFDKKDAIECMKCGAVDYILKDNISQLGPAVHRALKEADERLQRRQAEEKIKTSEERFRILFESAKDGFFLIDKNWKYIDVNPAYCRMFGYTRDEFLKSDMMLVLFLYDIEKVFEDGKSIGKDKYFFPEYRMRKKDRSEIRVDLTITPFNAGGEELMLGIIRDVTERKRTAETLRESEELFRNIFETAPGFLVITDEKGNNLYVSPNCEKITGYTKKELEEKIIWWVHEDDTPRAKELFDKTFSEGIRYKNYEYKFLTKKGELRYALSSWEPLKDKDGKFKGIVLQTIDVTERKQAEGKLIKSEEKYRTLIETMKEGIITVDKNENITFVNQAACGIFEYSQKELLVKNLKELTTPEEFRKIIKKTSIRKSGKSDIYELSIIRKDGEARIISVSASPVTGADGKYQGSFGIFHDITERKRAEEKLIESEEKYRQLAETAKDIILLSDLKGNVKYVNRESLRLTGYSEKEALQMNVMDMLAKDCIPATKERFAQRQKGKNDIFVYDAEFFDKKGDKIPIEVKSSLISEQGKPSGVLIIARDITERKLAEQTLKNKILELNSFINNIPDMAWLKDTDSRFIAVNRAFCETVGIDAQSLITQSCEVCFGKEAAENFKKDDQKVMKGRKQVIFEEKILDSQKNNIWLETIKSPIFDESGKVLGTVGIARDINERKHSEKRIERLNNVLKAIRSVDHLIMFEKDRNNLLQKACDIMIETRSYEGAWLGFLKDEKNFEVVKGSGFGEDVSRFINHTISGDHPRCIRNALSDGNSFILIDKSKDCGKCFFKKPCAGKEAAIIHVEHDGKLFGLMAILFGADISVDDEEEELLNELAGDIGLALHNMELKESSKKSEEALKHKLLALSQPVYEISGLQLTDIIDIDILQKLQDGFAKSYGVASLIFDNNGKPITTPSNFSDFCKIIRSTKKGMERCEISDENLTKITAKNESVIIPCINFKEILDAAVPVFIGDKQVAAWGVGQKLIGELSEDKVRGYAKEIGADAKQLIAASKKLESCSKEQFERMVSFIKTLAKNISLLGLQNMQQAREITERSRAEETLKESEDKYRRLTETVTDIIFTLNKKGKFTYLSPVFEKVTGYSALDYLGRPFTEVVTPDYIESTVDKFKRGLDGEKIPLYEIELIHKDKRRIPVELNVTSLLDSRGQIIGRHGVARDISMRKQSEEELKKKNEELEIFNKMAVGRELKMIELKKEINQILIQSGKKARYKIAVESKEEESK